MSKTKTIKETLEEYYNNIAEDLFKSKKQPRRIDPNQVQVTNSYLDNANIKTNVQIVANTYQNISFKSLTRILSLLNAQVNQKLFRYFRKEKFKHLRIKFHCHHERVENNTHSNILLEIPPKYDVAEVVFLMRKLFKKINPKFELYYDLDVRSQFKMTDYATKQYNPLHHVKVQTENSITI